KKDNLRAAIQEVSGSFPMQVVYEHIGWRKIDGNWHYLHKGGAIGPAGNDPAVRVHVPGGRTAEFELPDIPTSIDLERSVVASIHLIDVAPDAVMAALLGAVYRAPLAEAQRCDFSLFLEGPSGAQKSELTALAQRHFGSQLSA